MLHDFKFPNITISKTYESSSKDVEVFLLEAKTPDYSKLPESLAALEKEKNIKEIKAGTVKSMNVNGIDYVIAYFAPEKPELDIVKAVQAAFNLNSRAILYLGPVSVNAKFLFAKLFLNFKKSWNMKKDDGSFESKEIVVLTNKRLDLTKPLALAKTQAFVQQLVDMPSNVLTPVNYAKIVGKFIKSEGLQNKIKYTVHDEKFMRSEKMGSLLAVAKGSKEKPVLLVLEYKPTDEAPVVFVGKGLTFDSGGISIKPSTGMDAMKGDMAGSAAAIGAVLYAAMTDALQPVITVAACCENMPSHKSLKPGDVIVASNGVSIEVLDTDAEGRLVLADALHFSKRFNGKYTIDLATLTGACVVALGSIHSGLFTHDDKLKDALLSAGLAMKDPAWHLPLVDEHEEFLESKIADISNLCLGKGAGASNGAVFLKRFAPEQGWCHLDVAGSATPKGVLASGRPLPMLSEFIDRQKTPASFSRDITPPSV